MSLLNDLSALALAPLLRPPIDDPIDQGADRLQKIGWLLVHAGAADFPLRPILLDASRLGWQLIECLLAAPLTAHAAHEGDSSATWQMLHRLDTVLRGIGNARPANSSHEPQRVHAELRRACQARLLTAAHGERAEMLTAFLRLCGCRSAQAWQFAEDEITNRLLAQVRPEYPLLANWLEHPQREALLLLILAVRLHLRRLIMAAPQFQQLLAPLSELPDDPRTPLMLPLVEVQAEHREMIDQFLARLHGPASRPPGAARPGANGSCPQCGWRPAHAEPFPPSSLDEDDFNDDDFDDDLDDDFDEDDFDDDEEDECDETRFDVPALEDESGSEAVAIEESDADLEGSDFELSLSDEPGISQKSEGTVVSLDGAGEAAAVRPGKAPLQRTAAGRDLRRRASIRWYRRMNPERMYPLTVVLSRGRVKEVRVKDVAQAVSAQQLVVSASNPFVVVRPVLPGIECYPQQQIVDVTPDTVTVRFRVLPKMLGTVEDARIEFYARDRLLSEVPVDVKVCRQTAALVVSVAGVVWPLLGTAAQKLGVEVEDSQDLLARGLREFLALPHAIEMGFGVLLLAALVLYWLNRPLQGGADTDVLAVRPMSLAELLTAGRLAAAKKQWEEAASYFEDAVNVAPHDRAAQAELRAARTVLAKRRAMSGEVP